MSEFLNAFPLSFIPAGWPRWLIFGLALAGMVVVFWLMERAGNSQLTVSSDDPDQRVSRGIVALELAASSTEVNRVLGIWDVGKGRIARECIWLDFLFIPSYGVAVAMACVMMASSAGSPQCSQIVGMALAWGAVAAMAFDVVENIGMFASLDAFANHAEFGQWPLITAICASSKFLLLGLAGIYGLVAGPIAAFRNWVQ